MNNVIETKDLEKIYPDFKLGKIDITIPNGIIVGLIGENGAGKSTLIKSILNIIKIDNGTINIFGKNYRDDEKLNKEDIGVVLDNTFFPDLLNSKDINCIMKSIYINWDTDLFYNYLKRFNIPITKKLKLLSKGMKKKIEIATALSHHPKLLILDEPTSGLDPIVRNEILDIFLDFIQDENNTILLSTHITSDLERIADHIIFIDNGQKILDKSRDDILDNYGILKCDLNYYDMINKDDIVAYIKNKYDYTILVDNIDKVKKKYKDCIIDQITLDELMVLMVKGVK